jgi:glucose dehydrogenase
MTKTATKGKGKVEEVMHEFKEGTLKSSSGKNVTGRKQAVAVALSEARQAGARIPRKKSSAKS